MPEAGEEREHQQTDRVELVYRPTAGEFREALHVSTRASAAGRWGRWLLGLWGVTGEHDRGTEHPARWSQVSRYAETPHTFVLLVGGTHTPRLTVLPKRGLRHPGDTDRLRAFLHRHHLTRL